MTLSRAKFNELTTHDLVEATMVPVRNAMNDAGLNASDISKVLLVGGSSRIPAVQEAVKGITGKEGFKGINPDECVAIGAAIQGGILSDDPSAKRICCCWMSLLCLWVLVDHGRCLHSPDRAQHHNPC